MAAMRTYAIAQLTTAALAEIATLHHEPKQPGFWDDLGRLELSERERLAVGLIVEKLVDYRTQRGNDLGQGQMAP
jgi:hypothetical protein